MRSTRRRARWRKMAYHPFRHPIRFDIEIDALPRLPPSIPSETKGWNAFVTPSMRSYDGSFATTRCSKKKKRERWFSSNLSIEKPTLACVRKDIHSYPSFVGDSGTANKESQEVSDHPKTKTWETSEDDPSQLLFLLLFSDPSPSRIACDAVGIDEGDPLRASRPMERHVSFEGQGRREGFVS